MQDYSKLDRPEILSHIFFPQKTSRSAAPAGSQDVAIEVADNISLGCRFFATAPDAPTLVYFHGNGETVPDYDLIAPRYCHHGMNIFIATYRGYGWSDGSPDVTSMFKDADTLWIKVVAWLQQTGYSGPLFVMGRSLGSASAIDLALKHGKQLKGLIIESGFADTLPLARALGLNLAEEKIDENECFNNREKIAQVKLATFIMHGARDQLIPADQAEGLQMSSGARNKQFVLIPGAEHNTMIAVAGELYFQGIKKFINEVCGINTWRQERKKYKEKQKNQA